MDLDEVKKCVRALVSSSPLLYRLNTLLFDFKESTGFDLPLFGHESAIEFLRSLNDIVQLSNDSYNPTITVIESEKSSHIISLVERQRVNKVKKKNHPMDNTRRPAVHRKVPTFDSLIKAETSNNFSSNSFVLKKSGNEEIRNSFSSPFHSQHFSSASFNSKSSSLVNIGKSSNHSVSESPGLPGASHLVNELILPSNQMSCLKKVTSTTLSKETKVQRSELKIFESQKTESYYFEDFSDGEGCLSTDEPTRSSSVVASASNEIINNGIKNKLKMLIKNHPEGLWCCDLPESFFEQYRFVLDYREFGYTSLIQMLSELPDVFRCLRPGNEDWILFDASVPPSLEEKKIMEFQTKGSVVDIKANVQKLLKMQTENSLELGVEISKVPELYQKTFGTSLDVRHLGFKDVKALLESWEGSILNIFKINGKFLCAPAYYKSDQSRGTWGEALPPITADSDIFAEIFPKEVVGPGESLHELDLSRHIAVGHVVEVCIAEVWSPEKFFIQLNKFKNSLNRFMDEMQKFYNVHLNKYKMPDSTIRPNQVCVGLYNSDPEFPDEWHRAQIIKVNNEKSVLLNFVDYGTVTRLKKSQLRFLHRDFKSFPIQAYRARLAGVAPPNGEDNWPMSTNKKFLELLRVPQLNAEIMDIDFEKQSLSVVLTDSFQKEKVNLNEKLVLQKLAVVKEEEKDSSSSSQEPLETKRQNSVASKKESSEGLMAVVPKKEPSICSPQPELSSQLFSSKLISERAQQVLFNNGSSHSSSLQCKMENLTLEPGFTPPLEERKSSFEENERFYEFEEIPDLSKSNEDSEEDEKEVIIESLFRPLLPNRHRLSNAEFVRPKNQKRSELSACVENGDGSKEKLGRSESGVLQGNVFFQENSLEDVDDDMEEVKAVGGLPRGGKEKAMSCPSVVGGGALLPGAAHGSPCGTQAEPAENLPTKPKRLPPGLENVNPLSDFASPPFLLQADELKKRINLLAMELLTKNESIKKVGVNDPVLALKIATEMAEVYTSSQLSMNPLMCYNFFPLFPNGAADLTPQTFPAKNSEPEASPLLTPKTPPQVSQTIKTECQKDPTENIPSNREPKLSSALELKESRVLTETQVAGKSLHLIEVDGELYVCAEELVRQFTAFSSRDIADRVLLTKKFKPSYRVISRKSDLEVFQALKSTELPGVLKKQKSKKLKIYLLQLEKVAEFLGIAGCPTKAVECDIAEIQKYRIEQIQKTELS